MKLVIATFALVTGMYCFNKSEEEPYTGFGNPRAEDLFELDNKIMFIYRNPVPAKARKLLYYLRSYAITLQRYVERTAIGDDRYREAGRQLIRSGGPRFLTEPETNDNELHEKIGWNDFRFERYTFLRSECKDHYKDLRREAYEDPIW